MNGYDEITAALVDAGYLSDADVAAALDVLADALAVEVAEDAEADASTDYAEQEDLLAEAEVWEAEDAATGSATALEEDEDIIEEASDRMLDDEATMANAEAVIDAACTDAAASLLAAELIDTDDLEAVATVIHEYRCS